MKNCKICSEESFYKVEFNNLFLRTDSNNKKLHNYESRVCSNCGVVYQFPQISNDVISEHYNSEYRKTNYELKLNDEISIDFPLQIDRTGISFQRFFHFFKIINRFKSIENGLNFNTKKTILDYGAYQGAFLYACKKTWNNLETIAYDYNKNGLNFAKKFLNVDHIYRAKNINQDVFNHNIDICVALHSLEHIGDPVGFLNNVKNNVLKNNGYVYVEVPCATTSEFDNPSHLFMYTTDSLSYLFKKCGYKILHISEEKLVNYHKMKTLKRHIQTSIHCLAHTNGEHLFNKTINLGKKTLENIKILHKKNSNQIFLIRFKKFLRESVLIIYYGFFTMIGYFSNRFSYKIFLLFNKFLKKINLIKKLSKK